MVHLRLNEKESNPNPHVNFISNLPHPDDGFTPSADEAKELLKALAAQVKPLMKDHGFVVNSLEEYEYNRVFAGRNWNAGECVELVLRRSDGSFYGTDMLLDTLCHELAHIKHMHHAPPFQKLWVQLRNELRTLQNKGYFGDGFWSSGQRLKDSTYSQGQGVGGAADVLPEYVCGGAHAQKRTGYMKARRPRGPRKDVVPSLHTGAQTAKKRKAGGRMTKTLPGEGVKLSDDGGSKGKQANSKRAREERALAIERRLKGLGEPSTSTAAQTDEMEDAADDFEPEDDDFRRKTMREVVAPGDMDLLRWNQPSPFKYEQLKEDDNTPTASLSSKSLGKRPATTIEDQEGANPVSSKRSKVTANMLADEVKIREREKLGMTGPGKKVGSGRPLESFFPKDFQKQTVAEEADKSWACTACTLINPVDNVLCEACGERR